MDSCPSELSLLEIRNFMVKNNCKVTNHALVKHFKTFLTNRDTQNEARKQFKTYVNILASIKNEGNEKYLILRKKYINEIPTEDSFNSSTLLLSPGARSSTSFVSEGEPSPYKQPPPYRPPPDVSSPTAIVKLPILEQQTTIQYKDCVNEFKTAVSAIDSRRSSDDLSRKNSLDLNVSDSVEPRKTLVDSRQNSVDLSRSDSQDSRKMSLNDLSRKNSVELYRFDSQEAPAIPPRKRLSEDQQSLSLDLSIDESPGTIKPKMDDSNKENSETLDKNDENKVSVKEKMMKFNRYASEEEAKVPSPIGKKKPDKSPEETLNSENLLQHPKAKEWLVCAAKANYQELAKLASEHPNLIKLQDMSTGYTALHWAAKHGNEDIVKLIAGTYKADVNARTNGGYTALHIAMQFGKNDIFELLCNVYKADRDLLDWSGKKALEYQKQMTSVSASTYSKIKARKKHSEKDSGFLRIGSLNVRVKKTTEAFSNFLGVGSNTTRLPPNARSSVSPNNNYFEKIHKSWGSADNIQEESIMPPPKYGPAKKRRPKRDTTDYDPSSDHFSQSMPTTPSQQRAPIGILSENPDAEFVGDSDSDTACGFDSNWRPTYI